MEANTATRKVNVETLEKSYPDLAENMIEWVHLCRYVLEIPRYFKMMYFTFGIALYVVAYINDLFFTIQ